LARACNNILGSSEKRAFNFIYEVVFTLGIEEHFRSFAQ